MTKYIAKTNNRTAIFLTNVHATFEASIQALSSIEYTRKLAIKNDPISSLHILVEDTKNLNNFIRIEKIDIALANKDRQALYHLVATVLDTLKS